MCKILSKVKSQTYATEIDIKHNAYDLTSKWYAEKDLPREKMKSNVSDVNSFYHSALLSIADKTYRILTQNSIPDNVVSAINNLFFINNLFSQVSKPFDNLDSEHLRFKEYKKRGTLIKW